MPETNNSFADFVKQSRDQKKKQAIAQEFLGSRGRKSNGPGSGPNTRENSQKPSLLSRMSSSSGVSKSRSSSAKPAANINDKWQHDMHHINNPQGPPARREQVKRTASASQVDRNTRTFNKFQSTLERNAEAPGFSIKGVANGGPTTVIASNFAPGTTAADIEAVMRDHARTETGGELISCRLITASPTVVVELVCSDRSGANNVIATFNGQKADGRDLYVYEKSVPNQSAARSRPPARQGKSTMDNLDIDANGGERGGSFQDGRFGFNEGGRRDPPRGPRRRF
ncbi:hypothetical protein BU24DRAFT_419359 [Aaosphaeria arxii CBS 175.79]|uniref:RRM domain-containing protein n=1 Tax=Aaosphaeria arxii CBS 175.79 TaxID=1450172 RepID=A0A6A5Y2H2_9PLEO|nr:uncharacterized protein BU24DRAFT_419359 [Aaosphaeria arxii CBS 175.79]KAF2019732.1 hypothetical protein BU24DRAFT_419359 [Aaosphaeria arxii CBS 175.79]